MHVLFSDLKGILFFSLFNAKVEFQDYFGGV